MSLPESILAGASGHVGHHNSLHTLINDGFAVADAPDVDFADVVNGDGLRWDASAGMLKRGPAPFIDVTAAPYNALGDNVDDTAAVLAAMTAGASLGRPVFFPNGIYTVTEPIPFRTSMVGESIAATKIRAHSSFVGDQLIDFDVSPEMKTIRAMTFDANFKTGVQIFGSTGDASGSSQALFSDLQFTNTAPGVWAVGGSSSSVVGGMLTGSTFLRCTFNNCAQWIFAGTNQDDVKFVGLRGIMLDTNQPTTGPPIKVWGSNISFDSCYFFIDDVNFTSNTVAATNSLGQYADSTRWFAELGGRAISMSNVFFESNGSNLTNLIWDTGVGHSLLLRNLHLNLNIATLRAVLRTQLVGTHVTDEHPLYHEIHNVERIDAETYSLVEFHADTSGVNTGLRMTIDVAGADQWANTDTVVRYTSQSTSIVGAGLNLIGSFGRTPREFNVRDYGAKGDGSADDTWAFQLAMNAAVAVAGKVVIPAPPSYYKLTNTITIYPATGTQAYVDIEGQGNAASIRWSGSSNTSIFHSNGWKYSSISGVDVRVEASKTGVVVWDIDVGTIAAITTTSSGELSFSNCNVGAAASSVTGLVGWRLGHTATGTEDMSFIDWRNCLVQGNTVATNNIGWVSENWNNLQLCWYQCGASLMSKAWTNVSMAGAGVVQGGAAMFFHGCGGSFNDVDFELKTGGTYLISGGRWESGKRFLTASNGGGSKVDAHILVQGALLANYTPTSNKLIDLGHAVQLTLDTVEVYSLASMTAAFITASAAADGYGSITVRNCGFGPSVADPFHTISAGNWRVRVESCVGLDGSNQATSQLIERLPGTVTTTGGGLEVIHAHGNTGTTETIDLSLGNVHTATLDNNCTFTFSGATSGVACSFRLHLTQDATGSRTVTWPASVKWPDGTAPVLSTGVTKRDTFTFETLDGGTIWDGYMSGRDVR